MRISFLSPRSGEVDLHKKKDLKNNEMLGTEGTYQSRNIKQKNEKNGDVNLDFKKMDSNTESDALNPEHNHQSLGSKIKALKNKLITKISYNEVIRRNVMPLISYFTGSLSGAKVFKASCRHEDWAKEKIKTDKQNGTYQADANKKENFIQPRKSSDYWSLASLRPEPLEGFNSLENQDFSSDDDLNSLRDDDLYSLNDYDLDSLRDVNSLQGDSLDNLKSLESLEDIEPMVENKSDESENVGSLSYEEFEHVFSQVTSKAAVLYFTDSDNKKMMDHAAMILKSDDSSGQAKYLSATLEPSNLDTRGSTVRALVSGGTAKFGNVQSDFYHSELYGLIFLDNDLFDFSRMDRAMSELSDRNHYHLTRSNCIQQVMNVVCSSLKPEQKEIKESIAGQTYLIPGASFESMELIAAKPDKLLPSSSE